MEQKRKNSSSEQFSDDEDGTPHTHINKDGNVDARILPEFQKHVAKNAERRSHIEAQWKDFSATTPRGKMKQIVHSGIPNEQRSWIWMVCSGAFRKKQDANDNCEQGNYYSEILEKNKKSHESGKQLSSFYEIEKDIARTFPGHTMIDTYDGQEKLKRILEAFARRNKSIGYCQSMNFIAGWLMIHMEEEDAFWMLTTIVEDICAGIWSKSMLNIQIDSFVLKDLVKEKLPSINAHVEKVNLSLLLISTKWFMCIFLSYLPSETAVRVWDHFIVEGSTFLFKVSIAIMSMCQEELLQTKDSVKFCRALEAKAITLFDWKELIKATEKMTDITEEKIEDFRTRHRAYFNNEVTPDQLNDFRAKFKEAREKPALASEIYNSITSTYQSLTAKLDFWYKKSKDNYSNYLSKRQVQSKTKPMVDFDPQSEVQVKQCAKEHIKQSIDIISQGIGARIYQNGKKYQGSFRNSIRDGYGILMDIDGKLEYEGYWKNDKKDGNGLGIEVTNGNTYKGDWKNDEYHGKGSFKSSTFQYDGEWRYGKQEGKGSIILSTGEKYDGEFKENRMEGRGSIFYPNGNKYEGDFKNNLREGKGVMYFSNGDKYDGEWKLGKKEGKGTQVFANGEKYLGDWKEDEMEGRGTMIYQNGDKYEGDWRNSKREGRGIYTYANGDKSEGPWINNKQEGKGTIIFSNGDKYEGDFKSGKRDGRGSMLFASGDKYDGEWKSDTRDGFGLYTWSDGAQYEGEWKMGKKDGKGMLLLANGDKYEGNWRDGKRDGKGMMLFGNGDKYEGDWLSGKIEGNGMMKFGTGDIYRGSWKLGKIHGHGVYTLADGTSWEGEFEDGFRIVNGVKYWPDGEPYRENDEETNETSTPAENQKSLAQSSLQPNNSSTGSVPSVQPTSTGARITGLRKNITINKTIEDIKKKNLSTTKK